MDWDALWAEWRLGNRKAPASEIVADLDEIDRIIAEAEEDQPENVKNAWSDAAFDTSLDRFI